MIYTKKRMFGVLSFSLFCVVILAMLILTNIVLKNTIRRQLVSECIDDSTISDFDESVLTELASIHSKDELRNEFSIGNTINSVPLPFYRETPARAILLFLEKVKTISITNEHLFLVPLLADEKCAKIMFKKCPILRDTRVFDWLIYEFLFGSAYKEDKKILVNAIANFYTYSHTHFMADILLVKCFYFQLETYMCLLHEGEEIEIAEEIEFLIDTINVKLSKDFSSFVYESYCEGISVRNPNNMKHFFTMRRALKNVLRSGFATMDLAGIKEIIEDSQIFTKTSPDNITLPNYCITYYHFLLKKKSFDDAITTSSDRMEKGKEKLYSYEIFDSQYVFFNTLLPR